MSTTRSSSADDTLTSVAARVQRGDLTSVAVVEQALQRIDAPDGEGASTFTRTFAASARAAAAAADLMRNAGVKLSPLAGMPISVKDLFDVAGATTTAGSVVLAGAPAATADAAIVSRLRAAGAAIVGATNMTELAFGGLGLNPHYGTPRNPYDRKTGRIPGGSSSGAAISVTDGMALAAIGSDTAGSVRIPAALCGLAGFKPTKARVPLQGAWPLSPSLDSIGPLTRSIACAAIVDSVLSGEPADFAPLNPARLRFGLPSNVMLDDLDSHVASSFERALARLRAAGVAIVEFEFSELADMAAANACGGFSVIEGYAVNREMITAQFDRMDPLTSTRWLPAAQINAVDYINLLVQRQSITASADRTLRAFDAIISPTLPLTAPPIAQFDNFENCLQANRRLIRNTSVANFLDLCALTVPCHEAATAPVGLMLTGQRFDDHRLLRMGMAIEGIVANND